MSIKICTKCGLAKDISEHFMYSGYESSLRSLGDNKATLRGIVPYRVAFTLALAEKKSFCRTKLILRCQLTARLELSSH